MTVKRTLVLSVLIVAWSIASSAATAETGLVLVRGDAVEGRRAAVGAAIETAARAAGWSLPARPVGKKEAEALFACADSKTAWTCFGAAPAAAGVHQLFIVGVQNGQSATGAPMVVITGKVIIAESQTVVVRQRYCQQCADDKLVEASTDLVQQILRDLAVRLGSTVASLKSIPDGAQITLDQERLGATNASYGTYPGKHVVVLEKPGYVTESREFTIEQGKTAEILIPLRPATTPPPKVETPQPSRLLPGFAIGGGALVLAFSGYAVYRGAYDDAQFSYERATPIAIATGVIGLGAIGTGLYLLWRGPAVSAPAVNVTAGGAVVGWSGAF
jgi:hypothetical protein